MLLIFLGCICISIFKDNLKTHHLYIYIIFSFFKPIFISFFPKDLTLLNTHISIFFSPRFKCKYIHTYIHIERFQIGIGTNWYNIKGFQAWLQVSKRVHSRSPFMVCSPLFFLCWCVVCTNVILFPFSSFLFARVGTCCFSSLSFR